MSYELRWNQMHSGQMQPMTHEFADLDEAKKFAQGLGKDADAKVFDKDGNKQIELENEDAKLGDKETAKQKEAASLKNMKTPAGDGEENKASDTRGSRPQDLRGADVGGTKQGPTATDGGGGGTGVGSSLSSQDGNRSSVGQDGSRNKP